MPRFAMVEVCAVAVDSTEYYTNCGREPEFPVFPEPSDGPTSPGLIIRLAWYLGIAVLAVCCERSTDEPAASATPPISAVPPPAEGTKGSAQLPTAVPALERQRCIVPLARVALPQAKPAVQCPVDPETNLPPLARGIVHFQDAPSTPSVTVELARSIANRTRGLMYRTEMPEDAGMLFSWDSETPRSFWMRNTCLPLDLLFIATDGTIVSILEQVPTLNLLPRPSACPAAHVLEVNAGWARRHGVEPGQHIALPQ